MFTKKRFIRQLIIAVIILIPVGLFLAMTLDQNAKIKDLIFEPIDMTGVADGTYQGEATTGMVTAQVEVTVVNHHIESIELIRHDYGLGQKAESLIPVMVAQNTVDVDAIAGATTSSEVIKSAVCQALLQGVSE
jgi:uncharacterized protein with FMN-binding domain